MASNANIRIKDIARLAGVSTGTVDRVLHGRGDVSESNRERINAIIRELDFRPNPLARSLAKTKIHNLALLFPEFSEGAYWERPCAGAKKALEELSMYHVELQFFFFDQYNPESFVQAARRVLEASPSGVVLAPVFRVEAAVFSKELSGAEIPFVYIDSLLPGTAHLAYFGQHSFHSGSIAARLLTEGLEAGSDILLFRSYSPPEESNQFRLRKEGFMSFLSEASGSGMFRFVEAGPFHADKPLSDSLADFFERYQNIRGAVTFDSRAFLLCDVLKKSGRSHVRVVGYDLVPENVEALQQGWLHYIIGQRPEQQAYQAVYALYNLLIHNKKTEQTQYMPIDIFIRENIGYYLDSLDR